VSQLYDSLVLGGVIELAGGPGGVPSTNPMCPGAVFGLDPNAWSLGDPMPTTDFTASLVTDGERPYGDRTSDRQPEISVFIKAPDYLTLAGARELLYKTIDARPVGQFTVVWTPRMTQAQIDAGQASLPVVYDCFRALPSKMAWGGPSGLNNEPVGKIDIKFEALPYGRSNTKTQLAFASPIASLNAPAPPPQPVVLDAFTSINSAQFSQTQTCQVGPFAAFWDPLIPPFSRPDGANCPLVYSNTFAAPLDLTGMTSLKLWVGLGSRYYFNHHPRGRTRVSLTYTLTDTSGRTLAWTTLTDNLPVSQNPTAPAMSLVAVRIPAPAGSFDITQVASYQLTMVNRGPDHLVSSGEFRWTCVTLDSLTAYPSTTVAAAAVPSVRGIVYDVHGVPGTHYAPVSVTAQSPPTPGSATAITATGPGNYLVPAATLYVGATCFGAGGPGASMTIAGVGGGGPGGEVAGEPQLPGSSTGVTIPYNVGAGAGPGTAGQDTSFGPVPGQSLVVLGHGGQPAVANSPAGVPGAAGSLNTIRFPGGAGRTASGGLAGGGGSSAGTAAAGNTPTGTLSQTFQASGSITIPSGAGPVTMTLTGPGGGGAGGPYGAAGGGGEVVPVTLSLTAGTYPFTIGPAGTAGSSGNDGGDAGDTVITIGSTTYTAHGGDGGQSDDFFSNGGGDGGQGSPVAGAQPGGDGGGGYPYSGGGGSSAAPGQPGNDGDNYGNPGIAPTGGGNGGAGSGSHATNGKAGQAPGGGGGGAAQGGHSGAAGGVGQIKFAYSGSGAPTSSGATAPPGGGNGGDGGAAASDGSAGSQPGGGGGGANSSGAAKNGGRSGDGKILVTPFGYAQFTTLLLHRPGLNAPSQLSPLINIGGVAPGSTEFPVPPIPARTQAWGFEDGTTSSFTGSGAAVSNSTSWANSGTHSLLITADGTNPGGQWGASSPAQPCTPGQLVAVTGTVKNPNGSGSLSAAELTITWLGAGSSALSTTTGSSTSIAAGGTAALTVSGQAPAGAVSFTVNVVNAATSLSGVLMGADDLGYSLAPPAEFDGTYTALLAFNNLDSPTVARTIQVTINQYETAGGTKWSTSTMPLTIAPSTSNPPVKNGMINAGNITLPYKALAKDNATCVYTAQISDTNGADTVLDLILLDNNGQTVFLNIGSGSGYKTYYVDEPDPKFGLGLHLGSNNGRPQAISVIDAMDALSGGPLTLEPGDNKLLAWSLAGPPALGLEFFTRWFQERTE
jgi:hypothetical protein